MLDVQVIERGPLMFAVQILMPLKSSETVTTTFTNGALMVVLIDVGENTAPEMTGGDASPAPDWVNDVTQSTPYWPGNTVVLRDAKSVQRTLLS